MILAVAPHSLYGKNLFLSVNSGAMTQKTPREQPPGVKGLPANEPMFIKCFEDEKLQARAEGLHCYLGERVRKEDGMEGRDKTFLRSSPGAPWAVQPGWLCSALLMQAPVWAEAPAAPLFRARQIGT